MSQTSFKHRLALMTSIVIAIDLILHLQGGKPFSHNLRPGFIAGWKGHGEAILTLSESSAYVLMVIKCEQDRTTRVLVTNSMQVLLRDRMSQQFIIPCDTFAHFFSIVIKQTTHFSISTSGFWSIFFQKLPAFLSTIE